MTMWTATIAPSVILQRKRLRCILKFRAILAFSHTSTIERRVLYELKLFACDGAKGVIDDMDLEIG